MDYLPTIPAIALVLATPAGAIDIDAIYTNLSGHPTAQVPGVPGEQFRAPLVPFLTLYGSPNGTNWIFKAFTDNPDSNANDVILVGSGSTGAVVAKEGDPSPLLALAYGFMDSDCGINEAGNYAFGNRLTGGSTTTDEVLFTFDGLGTVVAVREGDAAPGLFDPLGSGDELYGNSLNSAHVLADGTVGYRADQIQNIDTDFESALYQGPAVRAQEGTQIGESAGADVYDSFVALPGNTFTSSSDGAGWIVEADILDGLGTEEAVIVSGNIAVREGDVLNGLESGVESVFAVGTNGGGTWFMRGETQLGRRFAAIDGTAVAVTGQPVTPGSQESFTNVHTIDLNDAGDYVVIGETIAGDHIAVLNGVQVIARTGDPVNLGGAGPPIEAFIETFAANDAFISDDFNDDLIDDREIYAFATLQDELGEPLGDVFLVIRLAVPCPWDCADGNGAVDIVDFLQLLADWGMVGSACDFNGNGVDIVDFLKLLGAWGPCP